jgi:hypothetical protein
MAARKTKRDISEVFGANPNTRRQLDELFPSPAAPAKKKKKKASKKKR